VQDQVLNRMERELQKIEGIDHVRSFARQGYGGLNFWMKGGTPKAGLERAWYLARKKIADVRHEFPEGVRGPFLNDEFTDVYSVLYAFAAPELSWPELQVLVEDAKRTLQAVPGVSKVDVFGRQAERSLSSSAARAWPHWASARRRSSTRWCGRTPDARGQRRGSQRPGVRANVRQGTGLRDAQRCRRGADRSRRPPAAPRRCGRVSQRPGGPAAFTVRHNGQPVLMLGVTFERSGNILSSAPSLDERMARCRRRCPSA
jgi:multidrug efflux pump